MSRAEILAAPSSAFPESAQFLGGYFHQDWVVDREGWQEVVDDYVTETPDAVVAACAAEVRALLNAGLSDDDLGRVLAGFGCSVDPSAFGLTAATWLAAVRARLEAAA